MRLHHPMASTVCFTDKASVHPILIDSMQWAFGFKSVCLTYTVWRFQVAGFSPPASKGLLRWAVDIPGSIDLVPDISRRTLINTHNNQLLYGFIYDSRSHTSSVGLVTVSILSHWIVRYRNIFKWLVGFNASFNNNSIISRLTDVSGDCLQY